MSRKRFKKVRELAMMTSGGRVFQTKERSVKDLSRKHALAVRGRAWRPRHLGAREKERSRR